MQNIIELSGVCRTFKKKGQQFPVLKDIHLNLSQGEMVAITGVSGSGKSTLLNILGCLDVPDRGDYLFRGQNTSHFSPDERAGLRREHIGFVFQHYHLMNDLTATDNVEIPAIYANCTRSQRRHLAVELLKRLGLGGKESHKPGQLSGGQQQRVSIARALMNGADIILADEPTGALDYDSGQVVLAILSELNQLGHTVVIVTHDMNVAQCAQRIIELKDGQIVLDTGQDVLNKACNFSVNPESQKGWRYFFGRSLESLRIAFKAMKTHRLRTLLTMTGIIIGIAAVVTVVALGEGARLRTMESIKGLGNSKVSLYPGGDFSDDSIRNSRSLIPADADALTLQHGVDGVSPEINTSEIIRFRNRSANASIKGVGHDYFRVNVMTIKKGSTFHDDRGAFQEVILDENACNTLFGVAANEAMGQIVFLGSVPMRVIGIVENNREYSPDNINAWISYSAAMYRLSGKTTLDSISLKINEHANNGSTVKAITQLIIQRHGAKDFKLINSDQLRKAIERTTTIFNLLILAVASISLLTGSLGVMNIMLVSVTERTHEIGIRMAVGARRSDIMQQFLIEALMVCIIGGLAGMALSFVVGSLFTEMTNGTLTAVWSWKAALAALFCSTLIGLISGYCPARKASLMNPVTSLTCE
ncbi:ATP-binding cassette domain-containing protein [Rahnella bruchi]|uniref:ATP-binding cassette domain-containing protein n=1 Tax=Rahnella bruchi TaxID=1510573 RepID=UPI000EA0A7A2|nr:ATP-binding cassette domain-containing protein [Rahnella bruchi]